MGSNPIPAGISNGLTNYQWYPSDNRWGELPAEVIQAVTSPFILFLDNLTRVDSDYLNRALNHLIANPLHAMIGGRGEEDLRGNDAPAWFGRWKHIYHTGTCNIDSGELHNSKYLFTPGLMVRSHFLQLISNAFPEKDSISIEFLQDAIISLKGKQYYDSSLVFRRYIPNELFNSALNKEIYRIIYTRESEFSKNDVFISWNEYSFLQKVQFTLATILFKKAMEKTRKEMIHLWLGNLPLMKNTISFRRRLYHYMRTKHHFPQKINLFIVGEQKCGTTSIHKLLIDSSDGQIIDHEIGKEVHFWWKKGLLTPEEIRRYEKGFWHSNKITPVYALDSTPRYAYAGKGRALKRILQYNPDAKLIYITRDPVKRFLSAYKMYKNWKKKMPKRLIFTHDFNSFTEANLNEHSSVFSRGLYHIQLKRIKKMTINFLILKLEDFKTPEKIYQQLEDFLGIELNHIEIAKSNSISEDEVISESTLSKIREAYKNHPENIYTL